MKRVLLMLLPLFLCGAASFNGGSTGASTTGTLSFSTNVITLSYWRLFLATNAVVVLLETSANASSVDNCFYASVEAPVTKEAWNVKGKANNIFGLLDDIIIGEWAHRVVVLDRSTSVGDLRAYTNGVTASLRRPYPTFVNSAGTADFSNQRFYVGARNNSASFDMDGLIQDLAIYAGEVSAAEAYSLGAQRMSPRKVRSAKLLYYWPFCAGENPNNSPDLVGGIPINSGTKSITTEQAPTFRK